MSPYVSYYVCDGCGAKIPEKAHIVKDDGVTSVPYWEHWEQESKQYFFCDSCYGRFLGALATIISKKNVSIEVEPITLKDRIEKIFQEYHRLALENADTLTYGICARDLDGLRRRVLAELERP
jgi:hypothetical protein